MWSAKGAKGSSGGMLTLWNATCFNFLCSFEGEGFIGIQLNWKNKIVYVVNVYSYCFIQNKRRF